MKLHGLSIYERQEAYRKYGMKCNICGISMMQGEAQIDHNHETDAIRGVLCKKCNRGIGCFNDSPENLERAAEYLRRPDGREAIVNGAAMRLRAGLSAVKEYWDGIRRSHNK